MIARELRVKYLGYACWSLIRVGKQNYTLYSCHGSGGSRFKHTKLKTVMDLTQWIDASCIAMGHVHSLGSEVVTKQSIDLRSRTVKEKDCRVIMTGSWLNWDGSYAQAKNMPISKVGSPVMKLMENRNNLAVSL